MRWLRRLRGGYTYKKTVNRKNTLKKKSSLISKKRKSLKSIGFGKKNNNTHKLSHMQKHKKRKKK